MICHWCARGRLSTKELALNSTRLHINQSPMAKPPTRSQTFSTPDGQAVEKKRRATRSLSLLGSLLFESLRELGLTLLSIGVGPGNLAFHPVVGSGLSHLLDKFIAPRRSSSRRSVRALLPTGQNVCQWIQKFPALKRINCSLVSLSQRNIWARESRTYIGLVPVV
jgi:hypothetical protein